MRSSLLQAVRAAISSLLCLLLVCNQASGSYLGCFRWSKLYRFGLRTSGPSTLSACLKICSQSSSAFYGLTWQQRCICGSLIPDPSVILPDAACTKAQADSAYVNYIFDKDPSNKMRCKLEKINLASNTVDIPWGKERITFNKGVMTMPLQNGYDGGRVLPKMSSYLYGMFSIQIKVSGEPRPVTAVYLASETVFPYQTKWVELDVEFLNSAKGKDIGPGTLWTNLFYGGKEVAPGWLKQERLQQLTRNPKFSAYTDFHTYSINWQSKAVDWHVDGVWVDRRTVGGNISIPDKPMWLIISLWSMSDKCEWFGGCGPTNKDYFSYFKDLRRITCKLGGAIPAPPGGAAAAKDFSTLSDSFGLASSGVMQQCGEASISQDCVDSVCCPGGQTCMAVNDTFWGCMGQMPVPGDSLLRADFERQDWLATIKELPAQPVQCGDGNEPFADTVCAPDWDCIPWNETFSGCVASFGVLVDNDMNLVAGAPCGETALPGMQEYECGAGLACQSVAEDLSLCMPDGGAGDGRPDVNGADEEQDNYVDGVRGRFDRGEAMYRDVDRREVDRMPSRFDRDDVLYRHADRTVERFEREAGPRAGVWDTRGYERRSIERGQADGMRFDQSGRQFDQNGRDFDRNGRQFDQNGRQFDQNGRDFDQNGRQFDQNGRQFDQNGRQFDQNGRQFDHDSEHYDRGQIRLDDSRANGQNDGYHRQYDRNARLGWDRP